VTDNIILIDKPAGWTSFDVVKKVKNIGRFKKVGHAGTLDPFATGLLVLGTDRETKNLAEYSNGNKEYEAVISFGETKDSYDVTGQTIATGSTAEIQQDEVRAVIKKFVGELEQVPPMYSAKKVDGVRLYKLARKGQEVERKPSAVTIFEINELSFDWPDVTVYVSCSKGTYIRSLAHDMGQQLGCGAYLKSLRRIVVKDFHVQNALTISEFEHFWKNVN